MVSPAASSGSRFAMVLSVIAPAGTISQTARGALSFGDHLLERGGGLRAILFEQCARRFGRIVAHDLVAAAHQAAAPCWRPCGRDQSLRFP